MNGVAMRENLVMPTDRWLIREMALDDVDFARDAADVYDAIAEDVAVAFEIGVGACGAFINARTGLPDPEVCANYSRMKHGDLDAVSFFAASLAAEAMRSARFTSLMREAVASERVVYMTTAAVFNVPSASDLLLRATAAHLNILLARHTLPPVAVVEQTRLSDRPLDYSARVVQGQQDGLAAGRGVTIVPEQFRGHCVVFLDDLFSTGYTIARAEIRLRRVEVATRFFLLAARIDPQAVGESHGQIEDRLNTHAMGGTLESFAPMLQRGHFAVVQLLLRVMLNPKHADTLPGFLAEIPTPSLLKLYAAAASDGYRHRRQQYYLPSLLVLERELQERAAIDAEGHILVGAVDLLALSR
ncbi:MAG: phosphoribosyltransferase family protein [Thermomicrobiales bacterium]